MASNYQDVIDQLHAAGLTGKGVDDGLQIGTTKPVRCRVEGDREKRGWYWLHELTGSGGDLLICGTFGVWIGDNSNTQKVELRKTEISTEQRDALRKRLADDKRRMQAEQRRMNDRAAHVAAAAWAKCLPDGDHVYLDRKQVPALDVRFSPSGTLVIPMSDAGGKIHGLQLIHAPDSVKRRHAKEYWPAGVAKKSHYHLIGAPQPGRPMFVAEGYATAASVHIASGLPVAVAFDANNLQPVGAALHARYPRSTLVFCADDDTFAKCVHCDQRLVLVDHPTTCPSCAKPHTRVNTGCNAAEACALALRGHWIRPEFPDEPGRRATFLERGIKLTDFNDLQVLASVSVVRAQIEAHLRQFGLDRVSENAANTTTGATGANAKLRPIQSVDQLLKRYSLVYAHSGAVFDAQEHCLMSLSDMRDACIRRDLHRTWCESPDRDIVRIREVGFDPSGDDPDITCNLFGGWPTTPVAGKCERLLDLLRYMCSADPNAEALYRWVLRWVAYPIQHPGAKMKSCLVVHGPQGTGKNLFFETVMAIYGLYADVIDQSAVEDKFNDWASRKLFMIADEVVARSEVWHVKNKLKSLITGDRIRINPKNFAAYWERNHLNVVFLSNEAMPVVLEEDDRRHCVIWTPEKRLPDYYAAVLQEIRDGGAAALHHYLLHLDLGDFNPGALPIGTSAKSELINLGLDSPMRFHDDLVTGDIRDVTPMSALSTDWFEIYQVWCRRANVRAAPQPKFINALKRHRDVHQTRERYRIGDNTLGPHSLLLLGDQAPPEGTDRQTWLGSQIRANGEQLHDYREAK